MKQFSIPLIPPSANHYKKPNHRGGYYVSKEAQAFIDAVCILAPKDLEPCERYMIELWFFLGPNYHDRGRHDLDNFLKVAIDALVSAQLVPNDSRVMDIHAHKRFVLSDRDQRTEYFLDGRRHHEREVFRGRPLSHATR